MKERIDGCRVYMEVKAAENEELSEARLKALSVGMVGHFGSRLSEGDLKTPAFSPCEAKVELEFLSTNVIFQAPDTNSRNAVHHPTTKFAPIAIVIAQCSEFK